MDGKRPFPNQAVNGQVPHFTARPPPPISLGQVGHIVLGVFTQHQANDIAAEFNRQAAHH